jgi:hypothetical protein
VFQAHLLHWVVISAPLRHQGQQTPVGQPPIVARLEVEVVEGAGPVQLPQQDKATLWGTKSVKNLMKR